MDLNRGCVTMSTIARCYPIADTELQRRTNAAHPTTASAMHAQEVHTSIDAAGHVRIFRCHVCLGPRYDLGTVSTEAAMLALDNPGLASACLPGDTCWRSDLRRRMRCVSGYGATLAEWEQLPDAAAISDVAGLSDALAAIAAGAQPLDSDLTAIAAQGVSDFALTLLAASGAGAAKALLSLAKGDVGLGNVANAAQLEASQLETDTALPSDSDAKVPSSRAVRAYVAAYAGGGTASIPLWLSSAVQWWFGPESRPVREDGPVDDGDDIILWHDLSTYRRDGYVLTARPTYAAAVKNGLAAIKFASSTSQNLQLQHVSNTFKSGVTGDFTVYCAAKRSSVTGYALFCGAASTARLSLFTYTEGSGVELVCNSNSTTIYAAPNYTTSTDFELIEVRVRGTTCTFYIDGAQIQQITGIPPAHNPGDWYPLLGGYLPGAVDQGCDVYLGSCVLLDGSASDDICDKVRAYLLSLWGLG